MLLVLYPASSQAEPTTGRANSELAPHAHRAHPTEDHFLPLFFALGAAGWGQEGSAPALNYLSREILYGMLAMDAMALQ